MPIPTRIDRYPAKMVASLACTLVDRYTSSSSYVLDPFCGSGAILQACGLGNLRSMGFDINPYAVLLSRVKTSGFQAREVEEACSSWIRAAKASKEKFPIELENVSYWYTPKTLAKFECLRASWIEARPKSKKSRNALLLCLALITRLCSRADPRSPKPYISKVSRASSFRRHRDPYKYLMEILAEVIQAYSSTEHEYLSKVLQLDCRAKLPSTLPLREITHIITSPPYLNAQDYYRNFKIEVAMLDGLLPTHMIDLQHCMIGTERGKLIPDSIVHKVGLYESMINQYRICNNRKKQVVLRYLLDMHKCIKNFRMILSHSGKCIVVCGDNVVDEQHILTYELVDQLMLREGFTLVDRFSDIIKRRMIPPKRLGHRSIIKNEVISCYQVSGAN